MGTLAVDCPHCGTVKSGFTIFGAKASSNGRAALDGYATMVVGAQCGVCDQPICGQFIIPRSNSRGDSHSDLAIKCVQQPSAPDTLGLELIATWPRALDISVPDHLPDAVVRAFRQAEENYAKPENEEAAGAMFRRVIELAIKTEFPDVRGDLRSRIDRVVAEDRLPSAIGEWAHEIRVLGNESVHDEEPVDRADLTAARGFVDAFLRYVFTLPKEIALRRAKADAGES